MRARDVIDAQRTALKEAEASGLTMVKTATLHQLFDDLENQIGEAGTEIHPLQIEKYRSDLAGSLAYEQHVQNWSLEGFRQLIALGQSTLKSIMLINGGAAVALLAFLGNLLGRPVSGVSIGPFASSLRMFVFGVFFSAVAYATTYFSQLAYDGDKSWQKKTGVAFHVLTSLLGALSMAAFLCGALIAYDGFSVGAP